MSFDPTIKTTQNTQQNSASESVSTPPEAPEAPTSPPTPEVVNNTTPETTENKAEMTENGQSTGNTLENPSSAKATDGQASSGEVTQGNPEIPVSMGTAQIPPNEPLKTEPEPIKSEPAIIPVIVPMISKAKELLVKARNAIQFRKRKKLDKIMNLFLKKQKISNGDVSEFLYVSDATATRYLDVLEKENKIKQTGKTGHAVSYTKI